MDRTIAKANKRVDELNNEIYNLKRSASAIDSTIAKFEALDKKIIKTQKDIEELRESFDTLPSRFFYVRLIDVVGSIDPKWGSRDSKGNLINDPWPTPFPSCGFDLDAIGVIHPLHSATNRMNSLQVFQVFPRENQLQIKSSRAIGEVQVIQSNGKIVFYERNCLEYSLEIELSSSGLYWLKVGQIEQLYWVP
jgi:hypothetical protein